MAHRQLPDADLLRKLLRYDPETGRLYWLPRTPDMFIGSANPAKQCEAFNRQFAGAEAFASKDDQGYAQGWVMGQRTRAHRVIWKMMHGQDAELIDHENGDCSDNRIGNLRLSDIPRNARNAHLYATNKSGHPGVRHNAKHGFWQAEIGGAKTYEYLGSFPTFEGAREARLAAEKMRGFSPRHGSRRAA